VRGEHHGHAGLGEVDHLQHLGDPSRALSPRDVVQAGEPRDVLAAGQGALDGELLRDIAEQPADHHRLPAHVQPEDVDRAFLQGKQRVEQPDGGRLARAVRAEQPEHLTALHGEVQIVDGPMRAESVGHARKLDCRLRALTRPALSAHRRLARSDSLTLWRTGSARARVTRSSALS